MRALNELASEVFMAQPRLSLSPADIDDVLTILNRISLFGALTDAQLRTLFPLLQHTHYAPGDLIFEEGDAPSDIYIVRRGSVELVLDVNGARLAEAVFTMGMCFGETAVIGIAPHTGSALARENTELIVLPRKALFGLWESDKELFGMLVLNIAREACRRLQQADKVLLRYFAHRE
jgi:CRP/FNR family cyclic AMP-dependent transcriptional regulator